MSRKVALSPSVDLDELASDTEGFSGADLQALVYNAQLEVIHETISATSVSTTSSAKADDDDPIEYTIIGGPEGDKVVKSRAEEAAFQRRVRALSRFGLGIVLTLFQLKRIMTHGKTQEAGKSSVDMTQAAPQVRQWKS